MSKWEYLTFEIISGKVSKPCARSDVSITKGMAVDECLAVLGNAGWEMAGSTAFAWGSHIMYFKRPKV